MGFVTSSSTIQLYAYMTQYARERILNGDEYEFKITHFSLHDDDINYQIAKNEIGTNATGGTIYNLVSSGFIPDITGDIDNCVKSLAKGVEIRGSYLTTSVSTPVVPGCTDPTATNYNPLANFNNGSCTYNPPPSNRSLSIGFQDSTNLPIEDYPNAGKKSFTYNFNVNLLQNFGEANPTASEISNTSFSIELAEEPIGDAILVGSVKVNGNPLPTTINFVGGANLQSTLSFTRNSTYHPIPPETELVQIKLKLVSTDSTNRPINQTKSTFIYKANIYSA